MVAVTWWKWINVLVVNEVFIIISWMAPLVVYYFIIIIIIIIIGIFWDLMAADGHL